MKLNDFDLTKALPKVVERYINIYVTGGVCKLCSDDVFQTEEEAKKAVVPYTGIQTIKIQVEL